MFFFFLYVFFSFFYYCGLRDAGFSFAVQRTKLQKQSIAFCSLPPPQKKKKKMKERKKVNVFPCYLVL